MQANVDLFFNTFYVFNTSLLSEQKPVFYATNQQEGNRLLKLKLKKKSIRQKLGIITTEILSGVNATHVMLYFYLLEVLYFYSLEKSIIVIFTLMLLTDVT